MELLGLLAGLFIALFMAIIFFTPLQDDDEVSYEEDALGRVRQLACSLNGDPAHDIPIQRSILALGAGGISDLLAELNDTLLDFNEEDANRVAHLEEVIADFGLVGLPTVSRQLERMPAGSPLIASLIRIIGRQGEAGADSAVRYGLSNPKFLPFLSRFANQLPTFRVAGRLATTSSAQLDLDLTALATVIFRRPEILDELWEKAGPSHRAALLRWLSRWLPICTTRHIIRGLEDASEEVRMEGITLARLVVDPALVKPLSTLALVPGRCQSAATHALNAQNLEGAYPTLLRLVAEECSATGLVALSGILRARSDNLLSQAQPSAELSGRLNAVFGIHHPDQLVQLECDTLIDALDRPAETLRPLLIDMLALKSSSDPRAREKLILIGGGRDAEERVLAINALAQIGDDTAPDLLVRAIGTVNTGSYLTLLQEAAQHIGPGIVPVLARRLRPSTGKRTSDISALLRALPYAKALPSLLLALDDVREPFLECQLTSTCCIALGQSSQGIGYTLGTHERGLLMPLLRYMTVHSSPDALPELIRLYDQHQSLRGLVGSLIDMQGPPAIKALRERIERGGDDLLLLGLEAKLALLEACDHESDFRA